MGRLSSSSKQWNWAWGRGPPAAGGVGSRPFWRQGHLALNPQPVLWPAPPLPGLHPGEIFHMDANEDNVDLAGL